MCFVRYDIEEEKDYGGLDESGRWIGMVGLVSRHVSKKEMKVWYTGWVIELAIGHYQRENITKLPIMPFLKDSLIKAHSHSATASAAALIFS